MGEGGPGGGGEASARTGLSGGGSPSRNSEYAGGGDRGVSTESVLDIIRVSAV